MMPSFIWEARRSRIALALHLLDPLGGLIVGVLTIPSAAMTLHTMFTGSGSIPSLATTALMWAAVLMASGATTVVQLALARLRAIGVCTKRLPAALPLHLRRRVRSPQRSCGRVDAQYPRLMLYVIAAMSASRPSLVCPGAALR